MVTWRFPVNTTYWVSKSQPCRPAWDWQHMRSAPYNQHHLLVRINASKQHTVHCLHDLPLCQRLAAAQPASLHALLPAAPSCRTIWRGLQPQGIQPPHQHTHAVSLQHHHQQQHMHRTSYVRARKDSCDLFCDSAISSTTAAAAAYHQGW